MYDRPVPKRPGSPRPSRLALVAGLALTLAACGDRDDHRDTPARAVDPALEHARRMLAEAGRCDAPGTADRAAACRTACDLGHSNSCHAAGVLAGEPAAALAFHDRACDGGSGLGCEAAARMRRTGPAPDLDAAERLDRRARFYLRVHCEQRHARSCLVLGRLFATRRGGPADAGTSATYLARACSLGLPEACRPPSAPAPF
jgi:hypothetical protein